MQTSPPTIRYRQLLVALSILVIGLSAVAVQAQEPPPPPPGQPPAAPPAERERVPSRLSYVQGDVSFWRPGAPDWTQAQINTPLAPGDSLYTGEHGNLEIESGPREFVRAGANTQLALDNEEPDFLQYRATGGTMALDLRSLRAGQTIEIDTPNAVFSVEGTGYYRVDVGDTQTRFLTRRGGHAVVTPGGGEASTVSPSEQVVIDGTDQPTMEAYAAPEVDAWDRWNYDRTDHIIDPVSARYVPRGVSGVDDLDHYGTWRSTPDYGSVWVPTSVGADWAPYSTGHWVWDPYYGWTWVDNEPWGWAPFHYGRWVHASERWCWAPGPVIAAAVYAPALVAFFGGEHFGVSIGIGAPAVGWVSLGWGEPVVPWWGNAGYVGVPSWRGWGGPHVVNNTVIEHNTVVNVTNINVYQNAQVRDAVVATRQTAFGRGAQEHVRVRQVDPQQLEPVRGKLPMQPVAESLSPRTSLGQRPPEAMARRPVVATRGARDTAAPLRAEGLKPSEKEAVAPSRIVNAPRSPRSTLSAPRVPYGQRGAEERAAPGQPPQFGPQGAQQRLLPHQPAMNERGAPLGQAPAAPQGGAPPPVPRREERAPHQPSGNEMRAPAAPHEAAPPPVPRREERSAPRRIVPSEQQAVPHPQVPAPAPPQERVAPHERAAPAPMHEPQVPRAERAPAPQPRQEPMAAPRPAPPPERHERAAPQAPRGMPGEPASRVYRQPPPPPMRAAPHAQPQVQRAPAPAPAPSGGGERKKKHE